MVLNTGLTHLGSEASRVHIVATWIVASSNTNLDVNQSNVRRINPIETKFFFENATKVAPHSKVFPTQEDYYQQVKTHILEDSNETVAALRYSSIDGDNFKRWTNALDFIQIYTNNDKSDNNNNERNIQCHDQTLADLQVI